MITSIEDYIARSEGCRYAAYDDATGEPVPEGGSVHGTLTIGYGHTGEDVKPGQVIDHATALAWLQKDAIAALNEAGKAIPSLLRLVTARRWAFTDMAFQLGGGGLEGFDKMLKAVETADWVTAAAELLASKYAMQTPKRAKRNAYAILNGAIPQELMWE